MPYCDIQGSFLGKKIDRILFPENRNILSNIVTSSKFKEWFGNGRTDIDGNPVLDETVSFTNEKGEKKTIFDFGAINFRNTGEVRRLLTNAHDPSGIYLYKGELFINNTKKDPDGKFSAEKAMKLINTIGYYYPDLLRIEIYNRKGLSDFSKQGVPLPIIKVADNIPLTNSAGMFSVHGTPIIDNDIERFNQLKPAEVLANLKDTMDEYRMYGLTEKDIEKISKNPEVTDTVYAGLVSFLKKINPNFQIDILKNLSADGIAYINQFKVELAEGATLRAMPEEVAHFFVEMLPASNPLRQEMMSNITSFAIYTTTLNSYKDLPAYQTDGKINYDKIKREAAAKLISEYIYALSTGDNSRVNLLTKTKEGFIQKWWRKFLEFWHAIKRQDFEDRIKSFMEAANKILNQDIEWLSLDELKNNDDVFYSASESNKVTMAATIIGDVMKAGKVEQLQNIIDKFRRDLAKNYIKIVREDTEEALNKELSKGEGGDINYLGELYDIIKKVKVIEKDADGSTITQDINTYMTADNQIINLAEFLGVVANMQKLAKAISEVSKRYTASGQYMNNISQIQSFRETYANFKSLIDSDLMNLLGDSGTGQDILTELRKMTAIFDATEVQVIDMLRGNYAIWMKDTMAPQNKKILDTYVAGVNRVVDKLQDSKMKEGVREALNNYVKDLQGTKTTFEARRDFLKQLGALKVPSSFLNSRDVTELFDKVGRLYTTNQAITDLLNGTGKDIDLTSALSHLVTAGIKNYDTSVANLANFILNKRSNAQNIASSEIRKFQAKVDPLIKQFKEAGFGDEYTMGNSITYIDKREDLTIDSKTGKLNYEDGKRDVVKFLGPVMETIQNQNSKLEKEKISLRSRWKNAAPGSKEASELREKFKVARKAHLDFSSKYMNSPFKKELRDFDNKWNQNQDFLDIKEEWDLLVAEERGILDLMERDKTVTPDYKRLTVIQQQKNALLSESNKTEEELKRTQLLKDYFKESAKFRVEDTRRTERNFILAKNNYESKLDFAISTFLQNTPKEARTIENLELSLQETMRDSTLTIRDKYRINAIGEEVSPDMLEGEPEIALVKDILVDHEWERKNTVKVRNENYYKVQEKILKEIEALKSIRGLSKIDDLISTLYKRMNDTMIARKDVYGQKNPDVLTSKEREEVELFEDAIEQLRDILRLPSGGQVRTYKILDEVKNDPNKQQYANAIKDYEGLIDKLYDIASGKASTDGLEDLRNDIHEYNTILGQLGLIKPIQVDASLKIGELWGELASLTERKPTEAYMERMQDIIPILEKLLEQSQNARSHPDKLSKSQMDQLDKNISNLRYLIGGDNGVGGLIEAIHGGNYGLLDQIINDEYYISYQDSVTKKINKINVEFKKYVQIIEDEFDADPDQLERNEFFRWFEDAHKPGTIYLDEYDPVSDELIKGSKRTQADYVRRIFYTYSEPADTTGGPKLYDEKRARRYRATKISDEFFEKQISWKDTDDIEDWTVDNSDGRPRYLPLSRKQRLARGDSSKEYLNEDFYKLKDSTDKKSKILYSYLTTSLKTYLQEQENKPDNVKSWFDLPVTALDSWQSDKAYVQDLPDRVKRLFQGIKGFFTRSQETDAEDQLKGIDQIRDVDRFTQNIIMGKVLKLGMNVKLPAERVNRNVLHAMEMYIYRSKDFDSRSDLNPFVKGLIDVMRANEKSEMYSQKKRTEIFNDIYNQFILEELPDNKSNLRFFRKLSNTLMRFTAFKITGDVVGGAVNYIQANVNNLIESFAYKYTSPRSYAIGYKKAFDMLGQMTLDYNRKSDYHYWTLMYQTFDFIQGEVMEDLLERSSTKNKLFDWKAHLMLPRKKGELHAQSAMAISILEQNKVPNLKDGKSYPMWSIYEKKGDDLALKEGFDPELYNPVNGSEFLRVRNLIWSINHTLHGNYAALTQTEASRHSYGKLAENMKRWFVPGFQRRFGRESFDVNYQDLNEGFYNTAAKFFFGTLWELIKFNWGGAKGNIDFYWNTPRKKENLRRAATEVIASMILFAISSFAFGYDGDDPDKNKKLKANSWLYNEMLLITLRTYAEQTAYIPVPPFGFTEMTRNLLDPFSIGKSTFTNAVATAVTTMYTTAYYLGIDNLFGKDTEKQAFYQKNTGGIFGKKGDLKLKKYLFQTFGYTGSQLDPAYYLRNYEAMQNRLK